jgi:CPA1 family monovalent cation:H+ antiporter
VIAQVWFVLAMLAVVILARGVGGRIGVPFTILLTLTGLAYALAPGPKLVLDPEAVLVLVLPPLLYSTARRSSLLAIRANLRPIVSLSVLLVLITAFAVGALVALVVPGMPLAVGLVLGAAVAPPDPVAALSIGRRAGMPPRLIVLIEGEGLLNDATALTTYQVAVVVAGLMVGHNAGRDESGASRLQTGAVWEFVEYLLGGSSSCSSVSSCRASSVVCSPSRCPRWWRRPR